MKGRLTFPFLDSTNKTGMSKQKERRKEGGKKTFSFLIFTQRHLRRGGGNMRLAVFKASSFEAPSLSTEMLSEIKSSSSAFNAGRLL